jgi:hypothetical protein
MIRPGRAPDYRGTGPSPGRNKVTDEPLETVFETVNPAEVAVIRSLLDAEDIPYVTRGEDRYDAFPGAFRDTVFSRRGRPVVFLVPASLAEDVRMLLNAGGPGGGDATPDAG